jgi:hypothetical protein
MKHKLVILHFLITFLVFVSPIVAQTGRIMLNSEVAGEVIINHHSTGIQIKARDEVIIDKIPVGTITFGIKGYTDETFYAREPIVIPERRIVRVIIELPYRQDGIASWYGKESAGNLTASGEVYDPTQMTAAHRSLPFGTMLVVTNQDNKKQVVVRVNDRGPFVTGRIVDVSMAAAEILGISKTGTAPVQIEIKGAHGN